MPTKAAPSFHRPVQFSSFCIVQSAEEHNHPVQHKTHVADSDW